MKKPKNITQQAQLPSRWQGPFDAPVHSHWRMQVKGNASRALRKLERLAQFKATDVLLRPVVDYILVNEEWTRTRLEEVDFLVEHKVPSWAELGAEMFVFSTRIATNWQLTLTADMQTATVRHNMPYGNCTGVTTLWFSISDAQALWWRVQLDQRYSRSHAAALG